MVQKSPANSKEKIFIGDTLTKSFEHRIADLTNLSNTRGLSGVVSSAVARIYDVATGAYLPIGGAGVFEQACSITPRTGTTAADIGAIVTYTVSSVWTAVAGDYSLLITYTFENSRVNTMKYRYRTAEKR